MKGMRMLALLLAGGMLLAGPASAETKTVTKQYSYQADEADSKQSARWTAREEARKLLLEELDAYLERVPEVKNFDLTKDEIVALTAGVTNMEITKETWGNEVYWLEAKISVDADGLIAALGKLRHNGELRRELLRESHVISKALQEKEQLNRQLEADYYDIDKFDEYEETIKRIADTQKKGENLLALAKDAAKKPGQEKQRREYRRKAIELLGEAVVQTELPEFRIYIPGKKYSFPLKEGEQTDHWITFPDAGTDFKLSQVKGSRFVRVYDDEPGAGQRAGKKNRLKLKAIKNSYIVLEVMSK
jgi:hypothetical protein